MQRKITREAGVQLERAIGAIQVRFGGHALVRASRLPTTGSWPTGQPAVDRVTGIGGLPRGRVCVLQGASGSGKGSLAFALLARASREHAHTVVIDRERTFDPWIPDRLGADLGTVTLIRPPSPAAAGEAVVALARAGAGFGLVLETLPEPALAALESAAARSGCLVVVVTEPAPAAGRALAHASSLTLELEWVAWMHERHQLRGWRSRLRCVKNKLAAPGGEAELELRYPMGALLPADEGPRERVEAGEVWTDESAAV